MNRSFILLIACLSISQFLKGGDAFVQRALRKQTTTSSSSSIATAEDIIKFAEKGGVKLSINTLGPAYRAVARASHTAARSPTASGRPYEFS